MQLHHRLVAQQRRDYRNLRSVVPLHLRHYYHRQQPHPRPLPPTTPPSPTINFIRSFFSGARSASPNTIMAARTKAQEIIDSNAVGEWIPPMLGILNDTPLTLDYL
jgi:hypothetical protein